jgi:hypothetical protein
MAIKPTPDMLAHCYDMVIASSRTLKSWKLPPSEDIKFKITNHKDRFAHHEVVGGVHILAFSACYVSRFETLISTMVHEIIHVHQDQAGLPRADNKHFSKLADKLCKELELDRATF